MIAPLLLLMLCYSGITQNADSVLMSVHYKYTYLMDTTQPKNPYRANMILFLGNNMSKYTSFDDIKRFQKRPAPSSSPSSTNLPDASVKTDVASASTGIFSLTREAESYYQNKENSKLTYIAFADSKLFAIEEPANSIDWKITPTTKNINGNTCQKAIGQFKGRTYEAWFCDKLPYNSGPWKLGGLPGLILEAYDSKREIVFEFDSFGDQAENSNYIKIPKSALSTTPQKFKKYFDALKRNSEAGNTTGNNLLVKIDAFRNGDGTTVAMREKNNPIEKDKN